MQKFVGLFLCFYAFSAGAFEDYNACEDCRTAPLRIASDERMAMLAVAWADTANGSATRLGQCVSQNQVSEAEALEKVELWSTILFKFRNYLDRDISKTSCYDEVFDSYSAGRSSTTISNCEEFSRELAGGDHVDGQQPIVVFDTGQQQPIAH